MKARTDIHLMFYEGNSSLKERWLTYEFSIYICDWLIL